MLKTFLSLVVLSLTISSVATGADRPPLPKLLPENTILMLRLDNASAFRETLAKSSMGQMLADPQLAPFVEQLIGDFGAWVAEKGQEFNLQLGELATLPQGEFGFALVLREPPEQSDAKKSENNDANAPAADQGPQRRGPPFDFIWILETKERSGYLWDLLDKLEQANAHIPVEVVDGPERTRLRVYRPNNEGELVLVEHQGVFVVSSSRKLLETFLIDWSRGGPSASLASSPNFVSAMSPCLDATDTPQITAYFDPMQLVRTAAKQNPGMQVPLRLLDQFGLGNVRAMAASVMVGGEEQDSIMHGHFVLEGARTGVLALVQPETGDLRPERWVPDDVGQYSTVRWNVGKTVGGVERLLEKIAGSTFWEQSVEKRFTDRTGLSLDTDVLDQLAGRISSVQWLEPPTRLGSQVTAIGVEVKNLEAAEKTLQQMLEKFQAAEPRETYASARIYPLKGNFGQQSEDPLIRRGKPHLMALGNYLFFSDSRPLLEKIARTHDDADAPRLNKRDDFELVMSEITSMLDGNEAFYASFVDPTAMLRAIYEVAQSDQAHQRLKTLGEGFAPAGILGKALSEKKLPPLAVVSQYFAPGGSGAYDDPTGLHFFSFSMRPEK